MEEGGRGLNLSKSSLWKKGGEERGGEKGGNFVLQKIG